jgi:integrase
VRVKLKGVNTAIVPLADGRKVTYYYAWRGGPRLKGEPGTPEFVASFNDAVAKRRAAPKGSMLSLLNDYQGSTDFTDLAKTTRRSYIPLIKRIEVAFGDLPLKALADRRVRGEFLAWRDRIASLSGRRQADYAWSVLARVISWGLNRGLVDANPCTNAGRLNRGNRREHIWSLEDEATFLTKAPKHLHLPLLMAVWTGQRQGDLLNATWHAYDGTHIRLKQSKTGARVTIPVGSPLKLALDAAKKERKGLFILVNSNGDKWTSDGFRCSWGKARVKAGITGVTFSDLRGTAVTRLALSGCTEAEIATLTGHSLKAVRSILEVHYLHRDPLLAEAAIRKLEQNLVQRMGQEND